MRWGEGRQGPTAEMKAVPLPSIQVPSARAHSERALQMFNPLSTHVPPMTLYRKDRGAEKLNGFSAVHRGERQV